MQGIELAAQFSISEQFSIGFSGHYIDTEFTKVADVPNPQKFVGDPISNTAKYNYTINAQYDFDWFFGAEGFALVDYNRQDGKIITARNLAVFGFNPVAESDPTSLVNAQLGAQWESFSLRLFGRNLTDEDTFNAPVLETSNIFNQYQPRTLGVDLSYQF